MPHSPLDIQATLFFASLFGILHVIFTLRVGAYRLKNKINLGDGDDKELRNRIRAHGNFIENVPIALLLLLLNDLHGTSTVVLISVGTILLISRLTHYLTIASRRLPRVLRPLSMIGTLGSILVSALWLVVTIKGSLTPCFVCSSGSTSKRCLLIACGFPSTFQRHRR